MKKKNILFVARSFQMGGQEKISSSILEYLSENSFNITCFACIFAPSFMSEKLARKGIVFHSGSVLDLYKLMRKEKFDAVYMCAEFYSAVVLILALIAGIKIRITHTHQTQSEKKYWKLLVKEYVLRPIINTLATDKLACSNEAGYFLYGKRTRFEWIKNGIETDQFAYNLSQRQEMREKLKLHNRFVIGNIGRFYPTKNQVFLLDIMAELLKQHSASILLLAGKGETEPILRERVQKLGLDENVIFYGETKNPALLYHAMDCFVMPSLGAEGLPLTALEAQCSGLPCFLADTIPSQTAVVNTIFIPLEKGAAYWADQIWRHSTNFARKDESHIIAQKGFSTQNMLEYVKVKYFDSIYVEK